MRLPNIVYLWNFIQHWLHVRKLSLEDRNILFFTLDTALQGLMMGGIFNFLSVFVVRLGASKLETSLLTSLPAIVMALASIPAGQVVQRQTNLVRYTNWVRVFHRGAILLIALLPFFVHDYLIFFILTIWTFKAIFNALLESSWMGVIADVIPPQRRASVNGARWAILSVVTAISVAIFGVMLDRLPFPLNYQIVFLLSFVGGAAGMGFFGRLQVPDNVQPITATIQHTRVGKQLRAYLYSLRVPAFVNYELTATVLRIGLNLPSALYSVYWIRELNASDLWIGWQSTTSKLALIAGYLVWGRVVSRKGYHSSLLLCTVCLGFYPVLTGLVKDQVWLPLISIVQGFFVTGIDLSFFDTLLAVCPTDRRVSFIAVNTLLASLAIFIAPILGSILADWIDIRGVFFVSAGIHIIAALLFWRFKVGTRPEIS